MFTWLWLGLCEDTWLFSQGGLERWTFLYSSHPPLLWFIPDPVGYNARVCTTANRAFSSRWFYNYSMVVVVAWWENAELFWFWTYWLYCANTSALVPRVWLDKCSSTIASRILHKVFTSRRISSPNLPEMHEALAPIFSHDYKCSLQRQV